MYKHSLCCMLALGLLAGCSKSEDENPECETKNFGVAKLTFANTSVAHTINAGFADKVVPAGKASDTLRLTPGVYLLKIHSTVLSDTLAYSVVINQCEESAVAIP